MIEIQNWGTIEYIEAWERQKSLAAEIRKNRGKHVLALCRHHPVITIGRAGGRNNIVCHPELLEKAGISIVETDRGGDITLHSPGQLVGYTIFDLSSLKEDLHWFLREIEAGIIEAIAKFGLKGSRVEGMTGVWIEESRKICAIGMHCSRWVTSHGFALNVNNDLSLFSYIIPCGIKGKAVTSISEETGKQTDYLQVEKTVSEIFTKYFEK